MPLPKPNSNQDKDMASWVSRCMSIDSMKREFPDNEQRLAVCHSQWRNRNKKPREQRAIASKAVEKVEEGYNAVAAVSLAEQLI